MKSDCVSHCGGILLFKFPRYVLPSDEEIEEKIERRFFNAFDTKKYIRSVVKILFHKLVSKDVVEHFLTFFNDLYFKDFSYFWEKKYQPKFAKLVYKKWPKSDRLLSPDKNNNLPDLGKWDVGEYPIIYIHDRVFMTGLLGACCYALNNYLKKTLNIQMNLMRIMYRVENFEKLGDDRVILKLRNYHYDIIEGLFFNGNLPKKVFLSNNLCPLLEICPTRKYLPLGMIPTSTRYCNDLNMTLYYNNIDNVDINIIGWMMGDNAQKYHSLKYTMAELDFEEYDECIMLYKDGMINYLKKIIK